MFKSLMRFLPLLWVVASACSQGDHEGDHAEQGSTDDKLRNGKHFRMLTVPAPLQIATAVKSLQAGFNGKLLVSPDKIPGSAGTTAQNSVLLGMMGVDMGYSIVNDQRQEALHYLTRMYAIAQQLRISSGFDAGMLERFKNNLQNNDSLYFLLLDASDRTQKFLLASGRDQTGILISSGTFIEGLYLACHVASATRDPRLGAVIAQQKLYLENLLTLMENQKEKPKEMTGLMSDFTSLRESFRDVEMEFPDSQYNHFKLTTRNPVSGEQLARIIEKISAIRARVAG